MSRTVISAFGVFLEEGIRALQEEGVDHFVAVVAVVIVPSNVHAVPFAVVHLNVIPHMSGAVFLVIVSENADAGDTEAVADELEGLGIALAHNTGLNECAETRAREFGFGVVVCEACDSIVDAFYLFKAGIAGNFKVLDSLLELVLVLKNLIKRGETGVAGGVEGELFYRICILS